MSKFINRHILLINRKCNFSMFQDVLREKGASCRVWSQFFFIILLVKIFYHVFKRLLFQGRQKSVIAFSPFSTPVEDGTYYVIARGGWAGGVPHSLSGAYLQDYASYGYETSWVDSSHQGGVQCTGTITFTCLIFELLPFVYFHTWILFGAYLHNYTSYGYEILLVDRSYEGGVQCMGTITLACLIFELLPFVYFHTWILSRAYDISKTILAMVMKFCGWIDLIKGECRAHEP